MGRQTGHCVEVEIGVELACYFNFRFSTPNITGRITAEGSFPLAEFPNANLVLTGGTGDFEGIYGSACTESLGSSTEFLYNFIFKLSKAFSDSPYE